MDGDTQEDRPTSDPYTIVERAERIVAERAGISSAEASVRIARYARFNDMALVDVCRRVIEGTVSLLHYGERRGRPPSDDPPT
jgi:hypothetical protein